MQNVQSMETLGNIPSEQYMHTYASQGNIIPYGVEEDPQLAKMSPSKRTAAAMEGSPMFTPLEVKFKNMKEFTTSAKKQHDGKKKKFPIMVDKDGGSRVIQDGLQQSPRQGSQMH